MEVKFASHCSYQIRYHQVYCVKYRKNMFGNEEYRDYLKQIIKEICERYWYVIEEIGTDGDHVHIFVWASPKTAPSEIIQRIKSITAKAVFKEDPKLKKIMWGSSLWTSGYYVNTVGMYASKNTIVNYIKNPRHNEKDYVKIHDGQLKFHI